MTSGWACLVAVLLGTVLLAVATFTGAVAIAGMGGTLVGSGITAYVLPRAR